MARPCGPLATCIPNLENYECHCNPSNAQCNKAEELPALLHVVPSSSTVEPDNSSTSKLNSLIITTLPQVIIMHTATDVPSSLLLSKPSFDELNNNKNDNDKPVVTHTNNNSNEKKQNNENVVENILNNNDGSSKINVNYDEDYYYEYDEEDSNNNNQNNENMFGGTSITSRTDKPPPSYEKEELLIFNDENAMQTTTQPQSASVPSIPMPYFYSTDIIDVDDSIQQDDENNNNNIHNNNRKTPLVLKDYVTRISGRYMSVDNDRLMEIDKQTLLKQHQQKKHNVGHKKRKTMKTPVLMDVVDENVGSLKRGETKSNDNDDDADDDRHNQNNQNSLMVDDDVINFYTGDDVLTTKELIDDMERIMKNGNDIRAKSKHKTKNSKKIRGACFTGADSYFHYNDAETMRQVISYKIDLNLRFKTHSVNGLILWTGRHSALEEDDFLSLGIENG